MIRSASVTFNPASNSPVITPIAQALPDVPPPPRTNARSLTTSTLRNRKMRDALMRSRQVKPMFADIVQASTHINALIRFVVVQLYRLEGGPRAILPRQVRSLLIERKAEHTVLAS
jgi:hypothetical protein